MKPDCKILLDLLRKWYSEELADTFPDCWVFGSLIYKDGAQFTDDSDVDIIILFPEVPRPIERVQLLDRLRSSVQKLERQLLEVLSRPNAESHITSVVPATDFEIQHSIHKSKVNDFFQASDFFSLRTSTASCLSNGLKNDEPKLPAQLVQAIESCQEFRNLYVACSVNGTRKVNNFNTTDPIPKQLARSAAQVADYSRPRVGTSKFDVNEGIMYVLTLLDGDNLSDSEVYTNLRDLCLRRIGRGTAVLEPKDVACLHELLFSKVTLLAQNRNTPDENSASLSGQSTEAESSRTVLAEKENEKVVWLLPRGIVLIESIAFEDSDAWAITLNYYNFRGGWAGGTHYHSSYQCHWETPEGLRVQLIKLGIPPGDRQFALGALRLAEIFRKHDSPYNIEKSIQRLPNASKYARYFPDGVPVIMEDLGDIYNKLQVPGLFRDVITNCEELKSAWMFDSVTTSNAHTAVQSLRHQTLVAADEFLGKTAPSIRFVSEVIDAYDEKASFSELKRWVDLLYSTLLECLSAAGTKESD